MKNWKTVKLGEVASGFDYGMNVPATEYDGENKYIRITDIDEDSHKYLNTDIVSPNGFLDEKYIVNENDILLARTGASTGKAYLYDKNDGKLFFAGFLIRINIKTANPYFVFLQTLTARYKKWVKIMSVRSGQPGINANEYAMFKFPIPSIEEQQKIAEILSTQDKVIELKQKLIDRKKQQKKWLMQNLLTGKIRLKGFEREWEKVRFKEMFTRLQRRNIENNVNVLTISAKYGLINQENFFSKSIASNDKSNYYLLYKGDFAYNKSYSNGYPFGAIKPLKKYEKGIVSPLYICFSPTIKNSCPNFYYYYFESGIFNKEIHAIAQEGARNHGLLNIGIEDFFNTYIYVPPIEEQTAIAEILSAQDREIELLEKQLEQEKLKKKALMQFLLKEE